MAGAGAVCWKLCVYCSRGSRLCLYYMAAVLPCFWGDVKYGLYRGAYLGRGSNVSEGIGWSFLQEPRFTLNYKEQMFAIIKRIWYTVWDSCHVLFDLSTHRYTRAEDCMRVAIGQDDMEQLKRYYWYKANKWKKDLYYLTGVFRRCFIGCER